jgi:NAD(P)-dependent dehydrogenase (short-subunit alcohol dehydrogenase family)
LNDYSGSETHVTRLTGRVAIVTGAGRGLGRAHALALAAEGAAIVVNDLGGDVRGVGADPTPAQDVVDEIRAAGGSALVSGHDVADWQQAQELVALAVESFGDLHVLINNAGVVRDRTLANLNEDDWDAVIRVHLKGHAATTKHALAWWRAEAKDGRAADRSVVMTSSIAGLAGNFGQAAYSSAKLAVLALSRVVALEGSGSGVRSNTVSPGARTRIALTVPGAEEDLAPPADGFDPYAPENVSPLIVWLADERCPAASQVFHLTGNRVLVTALPRIEHELVHDDGPWTLEALDRELPARLVEPTGIEAWAGISEFSTTHS